MKISLNWLLELAKLPHTFQATGVASPYTSVSSRGNFLQKLKLSTCGILTLAFAGCATSFTPPDPADLEYRLGDVYRTKRPLLIEFYDGSFLHGEDDSWSVTEAKKRDGQPARYLKNPEEFEGIKGVIPIGTLLTISKVEEHYWGRADSDWMVFGYFTKKPFENTEMSIYHISGDQERNKYTNGCVDRSILELIKRNATKAQTDSATKKPSKHDP